MSHAVQLFDNSGSRARAVATFVRDGLAAGDRVVIAMRAEAWAATAAVLAHQGVPPDDAIAAGTLVVIDAKTMVQGLTRDGAPDALFLERTIGELVGQHSSDGRRLRMYGEMVDVLVARGDFDTAQRLEQAGNAVRTRVPFKILCGYSAAHFTDPGRGDALRAIRRIHTHVHLDPEDKVATHLMQAASS